MAVKLAFGFFLGGGSITQGLGCRVEEGRLEGLLRTVETDINLLWPHFTQTLTTLIMEPFRNPFRNP